MEFKNYSADKLRIDSLSSRLTSKENEFRKWLMNYIIDTGAAFNVDAPHHEEGLDPDATRMIEILEGKKTIVRDEKGNVNFVFPVSASPTSHQVQLADGRQFHAMCAIDAMGSAFTLGQDIRVESKCSECGRSLSVVINDQEIKRVKPETVHVLHADLNNSDNWATSC